MFIAISAAGVNAQDTESGNGFYLNFGGGYAFGAGTASGAGSNGLVPECNQTSSSNTEYFKSFDVVKVDEKSSANEKTNAAISLGKGVNFNFGVGYMFNAHVGVELNGDYLLGIGNTVEEKISTENYNDVVSNIGNNKTRRVFSQSSSSSSKSYKLNRSSLSLTPAVKFVAPLGVKFSMFSRIGVLLPVSDNLSYEYSQSQYQSSRNEDTQYTGSAYNYSTQSSSSEQQKKELTAYFKPGYFASIGLSYAFGNVGIYGEVSSVTHSFEVKKGTITEWTTASNPSSGGSTTTDNLKGLDTYDKVTEYQKEYTVTQATTTDPNSPRQDVSFSLPASSVGVKVGILFKF